MDEYRREQQSKSQRVAVGDVRASFNDEDERRAELRRQKAAQEKREFDAVKVAFPRHPTRVCLFLC
jgi:hypothetical protein